MDVMLSLMGKTTEMVLPCEANYTSLFGMLIGMLGIGMGIGAFVASRWMRTIEMTFHYGEEDTIQFRQTYALEMLKVVFADSPTPHFPRSQVAMDGLLKITDQRFVAHQKKRRQEKLKEVDEKRTPGWLKKIS